MIMGDGDRGMHEEICGKIKDSRGRSGMSTVLSVWALLAKSSFIKVLAVVFLLAAAETVLFCDTLRGDGIASLEVQIEESGARYLFLAALGAVFFILVRTEKILDTAGRYTMMRLRIAGERLFAVKTAYNVLCLLVLFAVQTWLVFWFAYVYGRTPKMQSMGDGRVVVSQVIFMAFYRSDFLHSLFPMAEAGNWVRNVLLLLALGTDAAGRAGRRRQATQVALFLLAAVCFTDSIGTGWPDVICDITFLVTIGVNVWEAYAFRREMRLCREPGQSDRA